MTFDLERAVKEGCRTRDGRPVRIICTNLKVANQENDIVIAIMEQENEIIYCCQKDGAVFGLVNLPEAHEVTVQLYHHDGKWCADVMLDGIERCGIVSGPPWPEWGKPVTVRIEHED